MYMAGLSIVTFLIPLSQNNNLSGRFRFQMLQKSNTRIIGGETVELKW